MNLEKGKISNKVIMYILSLYIAVGFYTPANAYIDPGSTYIITQTIIAAVVTVVVFFRSIFAGIKNFLLPSEEKKESDVNEK